MITQWRDRGIAISAIILRHASWICLKLEQRGSISEREIEMDRLFSANPNSSINRMLTGGWDHDAPTAVCFVWSMLLIGHAVPSVRATCSPRFESSSKDPTLGTRLSYKTPVGKVNFHPVGRQTSIFFLVWFLPFPSTLHETRKGGPLRATFLN